MTTQQREYLDKYRNRYKNDLVDNILPFWMKNGFDRKNGGVYTCVDRDGKLMDSTKSVWFQGRFGYIAAAAYRSIEPNAEWLAASKSALDFIEAHCIDTDGHMFFSVTAEGEPIQKRRYVFSECFAAIAMAEYAKASKDYSYAMKALDMFRNIQHMLNTPGFLPAKTMTPASGHSITMILINVALVLREVIEDPILDIQIDKSVDELKRYFMHPEYRTILEMVGPKGEFINTGAGRTINPGHCMETGWFLLELARVRNGDTELVKMATTIIDWAWEWGWDEEFGGIINFRDCRNFPPQDYSQDMKFWWPQCETILAALYAYRATGDAKYLDMYQKINEYTYKFFPDPQFGEWYGYLHRNGSVAQPAKGNLFKGPFHIPRMLMKASQLCDEIINQ